MSNYKICPVAKRPVSKMSNILILKRIKNYEKTEQKHQENILVGLGGQRNTEQKDYEIFW
jgi:hypothetical protein